MDNDDVQAQDVKQAETETADAPSSDEKTTQPEEVKDASAKADETTEEEKNVPYSRFKEVNDKLKTIEDKHSKEMEAINNQSEKVEKNPQNEAIKEQLKEMGFMSREDVDTQLRRQKEDVNLGQELSRLESKYSGKDGLPKFDRKDIVQFALDKQIGDPELAYKIRHEKAIIDHAIKNAVSKTGGVKSEASDGSSTAEAGTTEADLRKAIAKGDKGAQKLLLKRIAKRALG